MSSLYSLTPLTGKEATAHRTVVIGTVEMNRRVWIILLASAPPALILTALAWPFLGELALFVLPIVMGFAVFALHFRSQTGLKLRPYEAFMDKRKVRLNKFMLAGQELKVEEFSNPGRITPSSVRLDLNPDALTIHTWDQAFATPGRNAAKPKNPKTPKAARPPRPPRTQDLPQATAPTPTVVPAVVTPAPPTPNPVPSVTDFMGLS